MLILARLPNLIVIRKRYIPGWQGTREPGVLGDLLVLINQDRWIRIKGLTDDLKAVTAGQQLQDKNFFEDSIEGFALVVVYLAAALARNATQAGKIILIVLLLGGAGLLATSNSLQISLCMKGFVLSQVGQPRRYRRRLDLADAMIKKSGRRDWASRIGLMNEGFHDGL